MRIFSIKIFIFLDPCYLRCSILFQETALLPNVDVVQLYVISTCCLHFAVTFKTISFKMFLLKIHYPFLKSLHLN